MPFRHQLVFYEHMPDVKNTHAFWTGFQDQRKDRRLTMLVLLSPSRFLCDSTPLRYCRIPMLGTSVRVLNLGKPSLWGSLITDVSN